MLIRQHKEQLELINFKVPANTKKKFQEVCRSRNQQMTSVLNQHILDFIEAHENITFTADDDLDEPLDFYSDEY